MPYPTFSFNVIQSFIKYSMTLSLSLSIWSFSSMLLYFLGMHSLLLSMHVNPPYCPSYILLCLNSLSLLEIITFVSSILYFIMSFRVNSLTLHILWSRSNIGWQDQWMWIIPSLTWLKQLHSLTYDKVTSPYPKIIKYPNLTL